MENLAVFERQIDNAIFTLDHFKAEVTIPNILHMLEYSSDNLKLDIQSWATYRKVTENMQKRIVVYEQATREPTNIPPIIMDQHFAKDEIAHFPRENMTE